MEKKEASGKPAKKEVGSGPKNPSVEEAFREAQKDIEKDPDTLPDDQDLDEGELARKEGHP